MPCVKIIILDNLVNNLNTGFYKDLDTNFELACEMSEKDFSHSEIIEMLKEGNIPQKQIAALKLDNIFNKEEARILIDNLTGCDGKIREAVALKINNLLRQDFNKIDFFIHPDVFANATIDINGNICRLVIDSIEILKNNEYFADKYLEKIIQFINETFKELDSFIFRDKKYVINKQLFKLYWCLEALKLFSNKINKEELLQILKRAALEKEYTIREKVAQILIITDDEIFDDLKTVLKNDENYYVREVFK